MPGFKVVVNDLEFSEEMREMASRITHLLPANKKIGIQAASSVRRNFFAGGRPVRWQELSDWTKDERGQNAKPLLKSGRGVTSIQRDDTIVPSLEATDQFSAFGTDVDYMLIHNEGGFTAVQRIPGVTVKAHKRTMASGTIASVRSFTRVQVVASHKIPKREFMLIQNSDYPIFLEILAEHAEL